jgi:ABC-type dipeptide/oligopeptide/nickel transport system ATPase subunit
MAKRSLYASEQGAKLARKIFERRGWTQEHLAAELDLRTRQPIWRFFTCRPIERYIFIELCTLLDLNWWEIAQDAPEPLLSSADKPSEQLVKTSQLAEQIRRKHQDRIEHQCSTLRVLGTGYPVRLDELYVTPHLLGRSIFQTASQDTKPHRLDAVMPLWQALESQSKLRILGKPGSGKTTLLKWIALQCSQGQFQPDLIPVLIKLESYVGSATEKNEFSLLQCIQQELLGSSVADHQAIETLLSEGKFLLLLDELDEIPNQSNVGLVFRELCRFCERYHKNRVVITSRLGSQDFELLPFTDFELAEFNSEQISLLASKWFSLFERSPHNSAESSSRVSELITQLYAPENQRLRELAGVPLFFNRICQVFQSRGQLFEHRSRIYEECLALWLGDWDRKRGVQRSYSETLPFADQMYILGRIAIYTLERSCYCFEQSDLEHCIEASIREREPTGSPALRDQIIAQAKLAFLQQGVLLEQDCGIICFSQIAFQEHLAARHILSNPSLEQSLVKLLSHLSEPDWREVFLLVSSRLQDRTLLLDHLELAVQALVAQNPDLESLLAQLQQKNCEWLLYCQLNQIQASLYQLALKPELILHVITPATNINNLAQTLLLEVILAELALWLLASNRQDPQTYAVAQPWLNQAIELATTCQYPDLANSLLHLKEQLFQCNWSAMDTDQRQTDQTRWLECLSQIIYDCFNPDAQIRFESYQIQTLQHYLYVVQLFADCQDKPDGAPPTQPDKFPLFMSNLTSRAINVNQPFLQTTSKLSSALLDRISASKTFSTNLNTSKSLTITGAI